MKVCTATQMAAIDRETIAGGLGGDVLMERAGSDMAEVLLDFLEHEEAEGGVLILCGKGNNGGDGLVVARHLQQAGVAVKVLLLADPSDLSETARAMFDGLPPEVDLVAEAAPHAWTTLIEEAAEDAAVLVDAVFGTGITLPLRPHHAALFRVVNDLGLPCVGLDVPSGVCGDTGAVDPVAIACDMTITVQMPKLGMLLAPGRDFAGEIVTVDIGFPAKIRDRHTGDHHYLEAMDYAAMLPARPSYTHKYSHGKVLLVAGSRRFGGAAQLAAMGALRSGTGLVTLAVPTVLATGVRTALPEVIVRALEESADGTILPPSTPIWAELIDGQSAVAVGPGLDTDPATDAWSIRMQAACELPLVVDADGLNAWARLGQTPQFAHQEVVLTPHPGEMARLLGVTPAEVEADRFGVVARTAAQWNAVVMLKGSPSLIAVPDGRVFINASGDDALARGGSGDVLTGLIGGLLAQGLGALGAALLGAYIHGRAGTLAATDCSTRSVLVREVADAVGPIFEELEKLASSDAALREAIWPVKPTPGSEESSS